MNTKYACIYGLVLLLLSPGLSTAQNSDGYDQSGSQGDPPSYATFGGQLEFEYVKKQNINLDSDKDRDSYTLEPSLEIDFTFQHSERYVASATVKLAREREIKNPDGERLYESTFEVDEAYLEFPDLFEFRDGLEKISFSLGRLKIDDAREWLYDKSVDGILLELELDAIDTTIELSVNREEWIGSDLLRHNDKDEVSNLIAFAEHEPFNDLDIKFGAYVVVRDDHSEDNDSPQFLALRSQGSLFDKHLVYWSDFAWVRGEERKTVDIEVDGEEMEVDVDKKINGFGFDIGATYTLDLPFQPYFTVGYAFGSGDGDVDTDFRQTDLQGNSDKFGGIASVQYYGELLDPELSNMHIVTAGIGVRPLRNLSIDLVYHHYQQALALDELRNSGLDEDPDGVHKELGDEIDLVAGFEKNDFELELVVGYFRPGAAFDEDADNSYVLNVTLGYNF